MSDEHKEEKIQEEKSDQEAAEEYLNGWKRCLADFGNYRKDEAKRVANALAFANELLVKDLIAILDAFDGADTHITRAPDDVREGILNIKKQLEKILKDEGLEQIEAARIFNPEIHEALESQISQSESGTILEVKRKGYRLKGRVIRPAGVVVAVTSEEGEAA